MPMNRIVLLCLTIVSVLLVGCSHTSSESTVNADGSWSRTLKLTVGKDVNNDKWADIFAMPGPDWNKSDEIKDSEKITTLKRSFDAGEDPVTDIIIREKGTTKLKNYVMVRKLPGNRLEYYEKIVFVTPNNEKQEKDMSDFIDELKKAMPEGVGTDADYLAISKKTNVAISRMFFGPDDHLFGTIILNPDGAVRRLRSKLGVAVNKILAEHFGDRLTQSQRVDIVRKLMTSFDNSKVMSNARPTANPEKASQSQADVVGMSVSVMLPGKIVETNGEIDSFTGEVFWDFASNSAEPAILELRAICQL
jgi:hypothetical protein